MMGDKLLRAIIAHNPNLCFGGRELDQAELDLIKECRGEVAMVEPLRLGQDGDSELDTCPFCRSADVYKPSAVSGADPSILLFWVECRKCETEGPTALSISEAITLWNTRTDTRAAELIKARDDALEEAADEDLIEQAIRDVFGEGGTIRGAAEYVAAAIRAMKGQTNE